MEQKLFFPRQYIQGAGLFKKIPEIMGKYGNIPMALVAYPFYETIQEIMQQNEQGITEFFTGECTYAEIERVYKIAKQQKITVFAGIGGGKALDCAKVVADRLGIPVVIVPTIASTDAPCTGNAVIYNEDGVVAAFIKQKEHPAVVMVDTEIIAAAPARFLVAGMGDALSTGYEANSCVLKGAKTYHGGKLTETGLALARLASEIILKYGIQAKEDCIQGLVTTALEKVIEANILLSGLGFESCNIAAAHSIHNGLTLLSQTKPYQHGEKVAFGVQVGLHLNNANKEELDKVYNFCQAVGLPITLKEIGLENVTMEELQLVAADVCKENSFIYNEPVEISPEKVLEAIFAADKMGKSWIK
ncbi:MAG: glycerol dehydrogenase [Clostridia bacterium]